MATKETKPKTKKPKVPAEHPKYIDMIVAAVASLKERGGSSRQAIAKYIGANYKVATDSLNAHLKLALKRGVTSGRLSQVKGKGASGSFKVTEAPKAVVKKTVKPKSPKKPAAAAKKSKSPSKKATAKTTTPKKSAAKKPAAKVAKPKSTTKKSPKKPAAKKPTKKTKTPKKQKTHATAK